MGGHLHNGYKPAGVGPGHDGYRLPPKSGVFIAVHVNFFFFFFFWFSAHFTLVPFLFHPLPLLPSPDSSALLVAWAAGIDLINSILLQGWIGVMPLLWVSKRSGMYADWAFILFVFTHFIVIPFSRFML